MDPRRGRNRSHQNFSRRHHFHSDLNPGAHAFIPQSLDVQSSCGPSRSEEWVEYEARDEGNDRCRDWDSGFRGNDRSRDRENYGPRDVRNKIGFRDMRNADLKNRGNNGFRGLGDNRPRNIDNYGSRDSRNSASTNFDDVGSRDWDQYGIRSSGNDNLRDRENYGPRNLQNSGSRDFDNDRSRDLDNNGFRSLGSDISRDRDNYGHLRNSRSRDLSDSRPRSRQNYGPRDSRNNGSRNYDDSRTWSENTGSDSKKRPDNKRYQNNQFERPNHERNDSNMNENVRNGYSRKNQPRNVSDRNEINCTQPFSYIEQCSSDSVQNSRLNVNRGRNRHFKSKSFDERDKDFAAGSPNEVDGAAHSSYNVRREERQYQERRAQPTRARGGKLRNFRTNDSSSSNWRERDVEGTTASSNNRNSNHSVQVTDSLDEQISIGKYKEIRPELDEEVTSQRDKLIQILFKGTQECLVCCEKISQIQSIWSCSKCFNVLHLKCTKQWASSSHTESGWRCPACQNVSTEVPQLYQCFCKKQVLDIGWNRTDTPHSCGDVCNQELRRGDTPCGHRCTLLCHPGPCPVCEIVVTRHCGCGRTSCSIQCGSTKSFTCHASCDKLLNCLQHQCKAVCHETPCAPCSQLVQLTCFCGGDSRKKLCVEDVQLGYSCGKMCEKKLACGNHVCKTVCHPGACEPCYLLPEFITTCCCGKTKLEPHQKRSSCLDEIPVCEQECGKTLHCGELAEKHKCKVQCHPLECPPCKGTSIVLCNCKQRKRQIQCCELKPDALVKCNIKCAHIRSCGKHKCNQFCCTTREHICPLVCNRKLRCGTHKCELLCHAGQCPSCPNVSFDELTCRCGAQVVFPPVPCGTKPPTCFEVCTRTHACEHPPTHTCHAESECPPCVVFTEKWCYGRHLRRKNVFCYAESFSCGQACGKELKCHRHTCNLPCHEGDCLRATEKCKQLCTKPRPACGHACNEVCHPGSCPGSACTTMIKIACVCGARSETQQCIEDESLLQQFSVTSKGEYKILECDDSCAQIERNRRLALCLQISNPDMNLKLKTVYSDFLKQWAKKDAEFCAFVHSKLADLVKLAKESKQKSRSFSFEVMNRDKRQFIHQYCEFFGIESVECDPEPKRNVVVTAFKDRAWLPGQSLMETVMRDKGQPKVTMVYLNKDAVSKAPKSEMVPLELKRS